jgi:hypothetical protein
VFASARLAWFDSGTMAREQFRIIVDLDSAAFRPEPLPELCLILAQVAERLGRGERMGSVRVSDGEIVGNFQLDGDTF